MIKVMTIVGTRPELIRLSRTINLLDKALVHCLVHTGQNFDYELNEVFFQDLEIRAPDHFLDAAGESPMETIANVICRADAVMETEKPDALLLLGDTNSSLAAIAAKRRKIPIFHMEAGNRCFDMNVPEEINRKLVDSISDINLPYSQIARQYLVGEGFPADQIIVTGSPMREVCEHYKDQIINSTILSSLKISRNKYFVLSLHREENVDSEENLENLIEILKYINKKYAMPVIFSAHPRTKNNLRKYKKTLPSNVYVEKPFGFFDYLKLQSESFCVLSDSGTITEEASILGFNALNMRDVNERPEGFEEGAVMMVGLSLKRFKSAMCAIDAMGYDGNNILRIVSDYDPSPVSNKVLKIILSYSDFVRQRTWNGRGD